MKKIYSVLFILLICAGADAQSFRTGYFLDNYVFRYRINPAINPEESFFGIAVSNLDLQNNSTIGVSSLLYPNGGSIVTGLHSSVDANTFLSNLSEVNALNLDESINILSLGFAKENHASTIEFNVRSTAGASLPYNLFAFLKKGGTNTSYNIGDIYASANAFADLVYGYSHQISDRLSIGARVHALIGLASVNANGNENSISMNEQEISINTNLALSSAGLVQLGFSDGAIDLDKTVFGMDNGMGGFGASIDLGAIYKPVDGLELSFSVNDLGGISWKNNVNAEAYGAHSFKGGNITFNGGNVTSDFEDTLDKFIKSFNFKSTGKTSKFKLMPMTISAGARYRMPFYEGLSTGLLATFHTGKYTSWYDVRFGATVSPARIISATANVGVTSFGPSFGAAFNMHLGPLNLTLGIDSYIGKIAKLEKLSVPLNKFQENIHFGLAFSF